MSLLNKNIKKKIICNSKMFWDEKIKNKCLSIYKKICKYFSFG